MDTVTIPVVVGDDRRLVIDLPPTTPVGPAEVTIRPRVPDGPVRPARDAARAALLAAGFLVTDMHAPAEAKPLSDEEIARIGMLPAGARPSEDLVAEDKGPY